MAGTSSVYALKGRSNREANDHPEAVLLLSKSSAHHKSVSGSGALIARNVVLTAAHCVEGFDHWDILAPYAKNGPAKASAKIAKVHPQHKGGNFEHDLAVIILDSPIDIDRKYPTLYGGNLFPINTKLVALGRVDKGTISTAKLFKAEVPLSPFPGNLNVYGGNPQVSEKGDSGGPVFVAGKEREIVAVISGFVEFSRRNVATDLYVPLDEKTRDWIVKQIPRTDEKK
jgi:secreted trypsin-like serine protease